MSTDSSSLIISSTAARADRLRFDFDLCAWSCRSRRLLICFRQCLSFFSFLCFLLFFDRFFSLFLLSSKMFKDSPSGWDEVKSFWTWSGTSHGVAGTSTSSSSSVSSINSGVRSWIGLTTPMISIESSSLSKCSRLTGYTWQRRGQNIVCSKSESSSLSS